MAKYRRIMLPRTVCSTKLCLMHEVCHEHDYESKRDLTHLHSTVGVCGLFCVCMWCVWGVCVCGVCVVCVWCVCVCVVWCDVVWCVFVCVCCGVVFVVCVCLCVCERWLWMGAPGHNGWLSEGRSGPAEGRSGWQKGTFVWDRSRHCINLLERRKCTKANDIVLISGVGWWQVCVRYGGDIILLFMLFTACL